MFACRQAAIEAAQLRIFAYRRLAGFHQQEAQKRTALLADASQLLSAAAGVLARNQSEVAAHLLGGSEPFRRPQRQHHGQGRHRTHAGMGPQLHRRRTLRHFRFHPLVEHGDLLLQPIQRLQQMFPPLCCVGQPLQLLQLRPSGLRPQLPLPLHPLAATSQVLGNPGIGSRASSEVAPASAEVPHEPFLAFVQLQEVEQ